MGTVCVADTLRIAREENATSVELEVLENNGPAIAIYQRGGFEQVGELVAWRREQRSIAGTAAYGYSRTHRETRPTSPRSRGIPRPAGSASRVASRWPLRS